MFALRPSQIQPIGLDIGSDSIKLLQLEVSQGTLKVHAAARREVPEEARNNPQLRLPVALDLVRQMLRQHDFHGRSVVTALPREIVQVKNLRLPKIPPAEIEAAVQFEAGNIFSCDTARAHVRHLYAGEVRQGTETKQELVVLAARHEEVDGFVEQLHRSGCIIESLDFEPCAIYRSIERFIRRREDENEVFVLVDVGLRCTQVIIGRGREMSFFKPIDLGGQHFNEAVSRKLQITAEEARDLRRRMIDESLTTTPAERDTQRDAVRQAVFDATRSQMDELAREIALCLRYHSVTFRGHRPSRLRLMGGEASDPQLQSLLSGTLPIPVEAARPLYSVDTSRMAGSERRGGLSEWAVAFGLGLKLSKEYFGARQRGEGASASGSGLNSNADTGAEVVDLSRAVQSEPPMPASHVAAAPQTGGGPSLPRNPQEVLHA